MDKTLKTFVRSAATSALVALAKKFPEHQDDIKLHLKTLLKTTQDGIFAGLVADDPFMNEDGIKEVINGVFSEMDEEDFLEG
ncbi:MAG: hypothetical protein FIB07_10635 [Candidatus Methanoperedens sp.]|nr:hypothetical protein [Candidatus Methanoperedens sp.]